jgi:hypothetical protein
MNMDTPVGPVAAFLMRPPGWPLYAMTGVAVLVSLWAMASPMPNGHVGEQLVRVTSEWIPDQIGHIERLEVRYLHAWLAWGAVLGVWFVRRLARGAAVLRVARRKAAPFAYWGRWLTVWLILGATVLVCMTRAPVYLGFWVSKGKLEEAIRQYRDQTVTPPMGASASRRGLNTVALPWKWWGAYPVRPQVYSDSSSNRPKRTVVLISRWGGFVYSPDGVAPDGSYESMKSLGDGWYLLENGHNMWP